MTVTVRFAPSPTGRLHVGNIRTALLNWLLARRSGGTFILRLDDTDVARSTAEFAEAIQTDLAWLGLTWDRLERQSDRFARYGEVVAQLAAAGRLYPCYETPEELDRRRKRQLARGLPPIYDRAALKLTPEDRARLEAEGRRPHWRFLLRGDAGPGVPGAAAEAGMGAELARWHDLIRGPQGIGLGSLSDPTLVREDGGYLYTLASVIDDIDFEITHVVRGEDHVANTAVQLDIFAALGATPPAFAHHSLLVGPDGEALSKRLGALSVAGLRDDGLEALAVTAYSAAIGTSDAVIPVRGLDALVERFDLAKLARAPVRFDVADLTALNARLLHETPFAAVRTRLEAMRIGGGRIGGGEAFWLAVRANLVRLRDAADWWAVVDGDLVRVAGAIDGRLADAAAGLLPPEPWDATTWGAWTAAVRDQTGLKGKPLFQPLRLALTGLDHGPEMKAMLPLIGRDRVLARLRRGKNGA